MTADVGVVVGHRIRLSASRVRSLRSTGSDAAAVQGMDARPVLLLNTHRPNGPGGP